MTPQRDRELTYLRLHALISTPLLLVLTFAAFRQQPQKAKFTEIDVERINVVEPNGMYRMVISNKPRSIGPIYKGKPFGYPGGSRPGIIFFNDEGTENGGLTFGGEQTADGKYRAGHHLSFDQFNQDQVVVLDYQDENGTRQLGLTFADRAPVNIMDLVQEYDSIQKMPDGTAKTEAMQRLQAPRNGVPMYAPRVYVGRDRTRASVLRMSDPMGRPRIRMTVDSTGSPSLEFLNDSGRVTTRIPERR